LRGKSIWLIEWQKAGLENLLGNPCIKRRIRRSAIRDYQMGEYENPSHLFNVAPTSQYRGPYPTIEDYALKARIMKGITGVGFIGDPVVIQRLRNN
jgi:hypothetical protein